MGITGRAADLFQQVAEYSPLLCFPPQVRNLIESVGFEPILRSPADCFLGQISVSFVLTSSRYIFALPRFTSITRSIWIFVVPIRWFPGPLYRNRHRCILSAPIALFLTLARIERGLQSVPRLASLFDCDPQPNCPFDFPPFCFLVTRIA